MQSFNELCPVPLGIGQNPLKTVRKQLASRIFKSTADNTAVCMSINKAVFRDRFEEASRGY